MEQVLWTPGAERIEGARIRRFMKREGFDAYEDLHDWSVTDSEAFWRAVWEFCDVIGEPGKVVLADGDRMPGARWYPEGRLNFAENLLRRRDDAPAIVFRGEDGRRAAVSFRELYAEVGRLQAAFKAAGLNAGDRVAAFMPNIPETLICMLAVTSLGGIWSSASPDFGVAGVVDRFGQIAPRFLIACDGYLYKGRVHDSLGKLREILAAMPSVEHCIVVPFALEKPDLSALPEAVELGAFRDSVPAADPVFERFPFEQPLYILFSSGTTGKPKCIVHGAGGILLQHLKEHQLHTDLGPDDRLFYFTTTGWMMWNWLATGLASGATLVLFDGNPFHPSPNALWRIAQDEGFTVFGTSAKYLEACRKAEVEPGRDFDLSPLRALLSTGSPLAPESFDYVYEHVKSDLQLASISGGTDICSCFMLGCPILPVYRGEIQCRGLGMDVKVFDDSGAALVGEAGELVCTRPAPSMPLSFWDDPDGSRYRAAYFEHFPGVWRHGDLVVFSETGGFTMHGRSDATLNPGGVRIGTAEIYRQVDEIPEVEESVVVGQDWRDDQRVLLFVKPRPGVTLDDALRDKIRAAIRANTTPRHVPAHILGVDDIPRTRSGKISEIAVRDVIHGRAVKNTEALANPEALDQYRDRIELQS